MRLESLICRNFRVYEYFERAAIGPLTIFEGPNAVGKTSLLEAIQLMTALESFRTNRANQLVRWGEETAQVKIHLSGAHRMLDEELVIDGGKKTYKLNGKRKGAGSLAGLLPAVTFTPDDLQMVKGAPGVRRKAIDSLGVQVSKNYYAVRNDYAKLLKQKNQALKDEMPDAFIESIDDVLIRVGIQVLQHRMYLIGCLMPVFKEFYLTITGGAEEASLIYVPCWLHHEKLSGGGYLFDKDQARCDFESYLKSHKTAERVHHRALVGPHVDSVSFLLDGHDASAFASQGQQRSLVLAYKLAESVVVREITGQQPILLLDDVMSELDEQRRSYFMEFIEDDIQTFITTTNLSYFTKEVLCRGDVIHLEKRNNDVSRETSIGKGGYDATSE